MYSVHQLQNNKTIVGSQKGYRRGSSSYWKGVYKTLNISSKTSFKLEDLEIQASVRNAELSGSLIGSNGSQWSKKNDSTVKIKVKYKKLGRLHNLISKDEQIKSRKPFKKLSKTYVKIARKMRMFFPKGILDRALYECLYNEGISGTNSKQKYVAVFLSKIEENLSLIKRTLRIHDEKWWKEISDYFGCRLNYNLVMKQLDKIPKSSNDMKFYTTCKRFQEVFDNFKQEYEVEGDVLHLAENLKDIFLENYGKPGFICKNGIVEEKVKGLLALAMKLNGGKRGYMKSFATTPNQKTALKKTVKRLQKAFKPFLSGEKDLSQKKEEVRDRREEKKEKLAEEMKRAIIREAGRKRTLLKKTDFVNKSIDTVYELMEKINGKENVRNVKNKALTILTLTLREAGMAYDEISNLTSVGKKTLYQRIYYLRIQLGRPIKARKRHYCHLCKTVIEAGETYCYDHENTKTHAECRKKIEKQEKRKEIEPLSYSSFEKDLEKFEEDVKDEEEEEEEHSPLIYAFQR